MTLLVDTSVWSLAFRRDATQTEPDGRALRHALERGDGIVGTGLVLQELVQGFAGPKTRDSLIERFAALPFVNPDRRDHIDAAELRNLCRKQGVQLGTIGALLAQLCIRHGLVLLGADQDFMHATKHCELRVWKTP